MATKTLTMASTGGSSCNGGATTTETIQVMYPPGGIFGWKKRTLYLLLILLVSVVLIDMTLILWIIKILDLTSEGPGKIRISESGLRVESDAEFLDTLSARQIHSKQDQSLKLESSRNVTLMAQDRRGSFTNILSLGEAGLQSMGNYFTVLSTTGHELLHVDSQEMVVSANHMVVSDSGGLRLDGSLETPLVRGSATKDLRLESVLNKVKVQSAGEIHVDSPAGGISITGLKTMLLKSTGGKVIFDSSRVQMMNLKISRQMAKNKNHQAAYQVCMCENGRMFLAHREGYCQIQDSVCEESPNRRDAANNIYHTRNTIYNNF